MILMYRLKAVATNLGVREILLIDEVVGVLGRLFGFVLILRGISIAKRFRSVVVSGSWELHSKEEEKIVA